MSDHPEIPRVEFNENGESMNIEQAVARFRDLLETIANDNPGGAIERTLRFEIRPCDCDSTLSGRDEYCPLHGDKA